MAGKYIYDTIVLALLIAVMAGPCLYGQERLPEQPLDSTASESEWTLRQWGAITVASGIFAAVLVKSYLDWWKGNERKWGFFDPVEKRGEWFNEVAILGMDKIGHSFSAYFFYKIQKAVFEWGGFAPRDAMWYAAGFSSAILTMIEVGDGFSDYSFDYRDVLMNTAGILFALGRELVPGMQHFNFKWGYYPETFNFRISQNYYAGSFWLTADVVSMATGNTGDPYFVQPAIGYSVSYDGREREYLFGLDFDLNALLRSDNEYLEVARKIMDPLHLPAPGMKVSPGTSPEYELLLLR